MADPIWRQLFHGIFFPKFEAMQSKNKMADPIWRQIFHGISFSKIEAMRVVVICFRGCSNQISYQIIEKNMAHQYATIIPRNYFFGSLGSASTHFVRF